LEAKIFSGALISILNIPHGAISEKEKKRKKKIYFLFLSFFPIFTLLLLRDYSISETQKAALEL
jgi:hypothetical protein